MRNLYRLHPSRRCSRSYAGWRRERHCRFSEMLDVLQRKSVFPAIRFRGRVGWHAVFPKPQFGLQCWWCWVVAFEIGQLRNTGFYLMNIKFYFRHILSKIPSLQRIAGVRETLLHWLYVKYSNVIQKHSSSNLPLLFLFAFFFALSFVESQVDASLYGKIHLFLRLLYDEVFSAPERIHMLSSTSCPSTSLRSQRLHLLVNLRTREVPVTAISKLLFAYFFSFLNITYLQ